MMMMVVKNLEFDRDGLMKMNVSVLVMKVSCVGN